MRKDFPASFNSRLISCISLEIKLNPSPQCILYRSCRSSFDVRDVPTHHAARILQSLMPDVQQRWRTDNDFTVQLCVSLQRNLAGERCRPGRNPSHAAKAMEPFLLCASGAAPSAPRLRHERKKAPANRGKLTERIRRTPSAVKLRVSNEIKNGFKIGQD
jgi:hypothetical protein